jgi:2-polyprenyl-3-methyl-5-hydroxy-6-metoxy-1,4-benzoquinol methylase
VADFRSLQPTTAGGAYLHDPLLPENVFGHTKKVTLFREAIERVRCESARPSLRILDIGCGSGYAVTRFLGKTGDQVLGVDLYAPNTAYAQFHFKKDGLSFACMDVHSLSAEGRVFDIVVMADVLEHLDDPAGSLSTAVHLMAPGGRLLVTVPNGRGPFELESALSRLPLLGPALLKLTDLLVAVLNKSLLKGVWSRASAWVPDDLPYNIHSGHLQFFSRPEMMELLARVGLEAVNRRSLSFLAGPFTNSLFSPSQAFCKWNARVVDRLPPRLASAWFFECRRVCDGK